MSEEPFTVLGSRQPGRSRPGDRRAAPPSAGRFSHQIPGILQPARSRSPGLGPDVQPGQDRTRFCRSAVIKEPGLTEGTINRMSDNNHLGQESVIK